MSAGQASGQKVPFYERRSGAPSFKLLLFLGFLAVGIYALTAIMITFSRDGGQQLTLLLIGGLVTFLIALAVLVLVFRALDLSDGRFALGLPEGSIRAIIALALLLLFVILVLTIYFTEKGGTPVSQPIDGVTAERLAELPLDQLASSEWVAETGTYTITRPIDIGSTGNDLAKQVVTTVGTLLVAIASFYFGSTSVASATGNEGSEAREWNIPPVAPGSDAGEPGRRDSRVAKQRRKWARRG